MKKAFAYFLGTVLVLTSCGSHDHDHDHGHGEEATENGHDHEHEDGVIHLSEAQMEMAGIKTEEITKGKFAEVIRVSGQVSAAQGDESAIVARTSGIVSFTRDHLSDGSEIRKGEVIARVCGEGIVGGDAIAQNQLALNNAKAAYERAKRLIADSIISQKDFEKAEMEYESARLAANASNGNASGCSAVSPFTGFVKQVLVKQGEFVDAGEVLATVTKSCNLHLVAEVPEKYFHSLNKIKSANFKMGYDNVARSLKDLDGHLVAVAKIAEEGSAYIPVTFEFSNASGIVPGSFADIWLILNERENVLTIPVDALSEAQGVFYAYIQHEDDDDEFERKELRLGASDGLRVEVLSGLEEGEKVVTSGVTQVKLAGASGVIPEAHSHSH